MYLPQLVRVSPVPRDSNKSDFFETGPDAWSDTLAGIGPLILLIGERNAKQLLRDIRGFHTIYNLAVAPLGLLSVLTSLIRVCGSQKLKAYIGYELEARTSAAIEMTRINCRGVHAEVLDGYIVRSTSSEPSSQAIAISLLEGGTFELIDEAIAQIKMCYDFEEQKKVQEVEPETAKVCWCLHIISQQSNAKTASLMLDAIEDALGPATSEKSLDTKEFRTKFSECFSNLPSSSQPNLDTTFLCTFDALSEFCTSTPPSKWLVLSIGTTMLLSILAIQFTALWLHRWRSAGWIVMFLGYVGIVIGIVCAGFLLHRSCVFLQMGNRSALKKNLWRDGLLIAVKNVDSMDTRGSNLMLGQYPAQNFEAAFLSDLTLKQQIAAWVVAVELSVAFIAHYLGLRSLQWWVSVGELGVCLTAAFARSLTKDRQQRYRVVEKRLDKRCTSTGVIKCQQGGKINPSNRNTNALDIRVYSPSLFTGQPMSAESISWHAAKLCYQDSPATATRLLEITGMIVKSMKTNGQVSDRAMIVSFLGGILVTEGLAYPNARMCAGFRATVSQLAAPTCLLVRLILRQPQWMTMHPEFGNGKVPLGSVYIPPINSIVDWWAMSEDRNDALDLQKNLLWTFTLVNLAFYLALMRSHGDDIQLLDFIDAAHQRIDMEAERTAKSLFTFLNDALEV